MALAVWVAGVLLGTSTGSVQAGGAIPVRLIDGGVLIRGELRCGDASVPAHLVVELGMRLPLILHTKTAKLLEVEDASRLDAVFDAARLAGLRANVQDLRQLDDLTREHATALGEIPAVGVLGLDAFDGAVQLDLPAGTIRQLAEVELPEDKAPAVALEPGAAVAVVGRMHDATPVRVRLSTWRHDTLIGEALLAKLMQPGGAPAGLTVCGHDVPSATTLRPTRLPAGTDLVLGTDFLKDFRVTIEPRGGRLVLQRLRPASKNQVEQRLLFALQKKDADLIELLVGDKAAARLAREAAKALLDLRLADLEDAEALDRAMKLYAASVQADGRARELIAVADALIARNTEESLASAGDALAIARQYQQADLNATAVHQISARQGLLAMKSGDMKSARRHLLSAAFGMPRDPRLNVWLGQFYRRSGQDVRAWSRFIEAILTDDPPAEAFAGLDELGRDAKFRQAFTMADAELILEGRLPAYSSPRPRTDVPKARLVELFTDINTKDVLGPGMAFAALAEWCEGTPTVLVAHHIDTVLPSGIAFARHKAYELEDAPALVVDGVWVEKQAGDDKAAAAIFEKYASMAMAGVDSPGSIGLRATAVRGGDKIEVRVEPQLREALPQDLRLHAMIVERCVFAAARDGAALRYNVVRCAISPEDGWAAGKSVQAKVAVGVIAQRVAEAWDKPPVEPRGYRMRPTYIDWRQCSVVVIAQETKSHRVWGAVAVPIVEVHAP